MMTQLRITSLQNPQIKNLVRLRSAKIRKQTGRTLIDGSAEVARSVELEAPIEEVFICEPLFTKQAQSQALNQKLSLLQVKIYQVTEKVYEKIAYGARKDGIVAVCRPRSYAYEDLGSSSKAFYVVLEGIEKPGNLGAIFRTCDGAGVDGIILCEGCSDVYNPNVIRASLATVFSVKFVLSTNEEAYAFLKKAKVTTYATLPEAQDRYDQGSYQDASAIILGNEHDGLTPFWSQKANRKIRIPMKGIADSLNVSSCAAVVVYEVARQRKK